MKWFDIVREELGEPGLSDDEAGAILWEHTAYPMVGEQHVREQLRELRDNPDQEEDPCAP